MVEKRIADWNKVRISNDFMFGKIMSDPELCKELLQRILPEVEIERIEYPEVQKTINADIDAKSVRLDVYIRDDKNTVYDVEMQVSNTFELPKRSRYYQSVVDLQLLDRGETYNRLNKSFIIFICMEDIFGEGRHIYTFENRCVEDPELRLQDETTKIFLNTKGTLDDVSPKLKAFLDYVEGTVTEDEYIQRLEKSVKRARRNRKWRHEYMTLYMRDLINMERGREEGIEAGRVEGLKEGIEEGKISALKNIMETLNLSIDEAMNALKIPKEEKNKYLELLKGTQTS